MVRKREAEGQIPQTAKRGAKAYPNIGSELYLYGMHTGEVKRGWICERHLHHRMLEINLVLEGVQTVFIGQTRVVQHTGDLLLIPPMRLHGMEAAQSAILRYFVLHVQVSSPAFVGLIRSAESFSIPAGCPASAAIRGSVSALHTLLEEGASEMDIMAAAYRMLGELERWLAKQASESGRGEELALPERIAREIERLLAPGSDDGAPDLDRWLERLASRLGVGVRHCRRVFQDGYGMPPRDYLAILRQQEAMRLLAGGDDTIEHIARRTGYDSAQSLIRQFRKWTGTTPGEFRSRHRGELLFLTPLDVRGTRS